MTVKRDNYSAEHIGPFEDLLKRDFMGFYGKYFVGAELGLTGCDVSLNRLPAEAGSLSQATLVDGIRTATKTSWMKKFGEGR